MIRILYVDGVEVTAPPEKWRELRGDGIDKVWVFNVGFSGHSLYWLYKEGEDWVAGAASCYENVKTGELIVHPDGSQETRAIEWVPDLIHADMKLGWWWPGTEGKPYG